MYIHSQNVMAEYERLKNRILVRKDEFTRFIVFLENETTWLKSPVSTKYHLCCEQGLLIHSVGVAHTILEIKEALLPIIDEESAIICGLFHDVGKLGMPGKPLYVKPNEEYCYNYNTVSMGLGVRSLYLVTQFLKLSDEEAQAICYHDGQYIDENRIIAHKETPLTLLLHYADYWTAHMYENDQRRVTYNLR